MIMYCPLCTRELTQIYEGYYICPECNEQWYIEKLER